ncbi:MAG TPA: response regulator [Candidatus Angelobacter sp.]|nr:response regulator [Candidatus Angelobacter sp.]
MVSTIQPVRLLIIDDDPHNLVFMEAALTERDLEIFVASDPLHGLELVSKCHPHIVVTDLMMPDVDGLAVLRRVKEIDPAIRVVIMTASPTAATFAEAVRCGATDYLAKPIPLAVLRQGLGDLIKCVHEQAMRSS